MTLPALLPLLSATLPLGRLPRTGWTMAGLANPETIAAHSHGVCLLALALAPRVQPALDIDRTVALAAVHDVPEALLTDLPKPASALLPEGVKRAAELTAAEQLLPPLSETSHRRYLEYSSGKTREARFIRLCDRLHMGVVLVGYLRGGARGLEDFVASIEELDCSEFAPCAGLREELLQACRECLA